MNFTDYLSSKNPAAAMGGAMSGGAGGSFGALAMQSVQEAARQRNIGGAMNSNGGQMPGGPSLPAVERGEAPPAQPQGMDPTVIPGGGYMQPAQMGQMGLSPGSTMPDPNNPMMQILANAGIGYGQPMGQQPPPGQQPYQPQNDLQMQDPEFARGYELGMMLKQLQSQMG